MSSNRWWSGGITYSVCVNYSTRRKSCVSIWVLWPWALPRVIHRRQNLQVLPEWFIIFKLISNYLNILSLFTSWWRAIHRRFLSHWLIRLRLKLVHSLKLLNLCFLTMWCIRTRLVCPLIILTTINRISVFIYYPSSSSSALCILFSQKLPNLLFSILCELITFTQSYFILDFVTYTYNSWSWPFYPVTCRSIRIWKTTIGQIKFIWVLNLGVLHLLFSS